LIQKAEEESDEHSLVITSTDSVPIVIQDGIVFRREDLMTRNEEADVIIKQQIAKAAQSGVKRINVVCENTDVFVLFLHFYAKLNLSCCLSMEGPSAERTTIDIGATAHEHGLLLSQLPAAHALSGCDTVAQCSGVGKSTIIKVLKSDIEWNKFGVLMEDIGDIIDKAKAFMAACYGVKRSARMSMS
jgi:5'-3' exonuclease